MANLRSPLLFCSLLALSCSTTTTTYEDGDGNPDESGPSGDGEGDGDNRDDGSSGDGDGDGANGDGASRDGTSGDGDGDGSSRDGSGGDGDGDGNTDGDDDTPPDLDLPIVDRMEPSLSPPGGLAVEQVPQFIVFGFDDNRYVDGMQWTLDTLDRYDNPPGNGNARTHDGTPIIVSFYHTSNALDEGGEALLETWRRAKASGHEVGNHTHTHRANENATPWSWPDEISTCNDQLAAELGQTPGTVLGLRAPFLDFNVAMFDAMKAESGMIYDCSLTHIPIGGQGDDWQFYRHLWPYTLHNGTDGMSGQWNVGQHPGIWEVPVYTLPTVGPERRSMVTAPMAGFDSTAYGTLQKSGPDFFNSMKWALDLRLEQGDNRAPLTVGLHSDTYSTQHTGYNAPLEARRKALVDFIEYALTKPDVRFVSAKQLLQWMSNPVPL